MGGVERAVGELEARLRRYPPERYPIQHATARFHLAAALAQLGRAEEAVAAARVAVELFAPLPAEASKALNVLGIALRMAGRLDEAADAFTAAAAGFEAAGLPLEAGAAAHNLGLVAVDRGQYRAAAQAFRRARTAFAKGRARPQEAAAARELGQALAAGGEAEEAAAVLAEAATLADRVGDRAGHGAALNALGLALLAAGDGPGAVEALRSAAAAHPRAVRPQAHAMAKANLALAQEAVGSHHRARLAARQALAVADAPIPVRTQAEAVLARSDPARDLRRDDGGAGSSDAGAADPHASGSFAPTRAGCDDSSDTAAADLLAVLDDEPAQRWPTVVREEVVRWLDAGGPEPEGWVRGMLGRPGREADLLEAWLAVGLEIPPDGLRRLLVGVAGAAARLAPAERDRLRVALAAATLRFAGPQWDRLRAELAHALRSKGLDPSGWV